MAVLVAFLGSGAARHRRLARQQDGLLAFDSPTHGGGDLLVVVAVDGLDRPAGRLEARQLVAGLGQGGVAVDGDVVVVEQDDQVVQLEPAGQRNRLVRHAFHQAAVAGDHPGLVVDQVVAETGIEVALGHGHADRRRQPLAQRPGGTFDAGGVAVFRVARRGRAPLAKVFDILHRHRLETGQMKQAVEQHRAMADRQHEAVAIGPVGLFRVVFEELRPQHGGHVGHAHRHALVAGFRPVHRFHGQDADGVGHQNARRLARRLGLDRACGHGRVSIKLSLKVCESWSL